MTVKRFNLRFNLKKEYDLRLWKFLQELDTDKYKSIEDFTNEFKEFGVEVFYGCNNVVEALQKTKEIQSDKKLRILMCGSLYFCGDVLSLIESY